MSKIKNEELTKMYEELSEETLRELGILEEAKRAYEDKKLREQKKQKAVEEALDLVQKAEEILKEFDLELRISRTRKKVVNEDGKTFISESNKKAVYNKDADSLPVKFYRIPLLKSLIEMNGDASRKEVINSIFNKIEHKLNDYDLSSLSSGKLRWEKRVDVARYNMKKEGLIKRNSPQGIWEISDQGRRYFESHNKD